MAVDYCDPSALICRTSSGAATNSLLTPCGADSDCKNHGGSCDLSNNTCEGVAASTPSAECQPCATNLDCSQLDPHAGCWLLSSNLTYCAIDCTHNGVCPARTSCVADSSDTGSTCQPSTTSGTCDDWNAGASGGGSSGGSSGAATGDASTGGTSSGGGTVGTSSGTSSGGGSGIGSSAGSGATGGSSGGSTGAASGGTTGSASGSATGGSSGTCTPYTWTNNNDYVSNFFNGTCANCHSFNNYSDVVADASDIQNMLSTNSMPPPDSGFTITDTDRANVVQWLSCGFPE